MISDQMFSHYVNRAKQKIRQLILDSCQLLAGKGNFHLLQQLHRSICRVRF